MDHSIISTQNILTCMHTCMYKLTHTHTQQLRSPLSQPSSPHFHFYFLTVLGHRSEWGSGLPPCRVALDTLCWSQLQVPNHLRSWTMSQASLFTWQHGWNPHGEILTGLLQKQASAEVRGQQTLISKLVNNCSPRFCLPLSHSTLFLPSPSSSS